jgi:hypothetical protein
VGLLRGYGNAIVPQLAAEFIQAYLEFCGFCAFLRRKISGFKMTIPELIEQVLASIARDFYDLDVHSTQTLNSNNSQLSTSLRLYMRDRNALDKGDQQRTAMPATAAAGSSRSRTSSKS